MSLAEILVFTCIIVLLILVVAGMAYTIFINTRKNEGMIQMQIEAGKVKRSDHITTLPYDAIKKIISDLIATYAADAILLGGLKGKSMEELSVSLDEIIVDICGRVWLSMSDELRTAALFYVSEQHLKVAIKDEVRLSMIARLSIKQ